MNADNYATLEASKRLIDAGIVLETDVVHFQLGNKWFLRLRWCGGSNLNSSHLCIPAPSMAEVWRELPSNIGGYMLHLGKIDSERHYAEYFNPNGVDSLISCGLKDNPTDALIDLLIWATEHKEPENMMGKVTKDTIIIGR